MIILKDFKNSGVYCIINMSNGKRYIGSSKNMYKRLSCHRSYLRSSTHQNKKLQNSWNKYSEESFVAYLLEICDETILEKREQYFIDNLKPEYNITLIVERNILSKESRLLQSETRKKRIKSGEIELFYKKIFKYNLNGEYIKSYKSIKDACVDTDIHQSTICRYLNGTNKKAGEHLWSLEFKEKLDPYFKNVKDGSYNNKKVYVLNYYTKELLLEFESIKECADYYKMHKPSISHAIKVKQLFKKQFMLVLDPA